jgi:hypothetical protein
MSTEAQRAAANLRLLFSGRHGIFLPFTLATDGLTAAQALHVPRERFNSIWGVVNHVTYWQEAALLLLQEADAAPTTPGGDTGGWHAPAGEHAPEMVDDAAWLALRAGAITMNVRLADAVAALDDARLHRVYPAWNSTGLQIASAIAAHNSYHTCEVITLRHLQGLWVEA